MYDKEEIVLRMAKCIVGPRFDVPVSSPYTLDQLREIKWKAAGTFGQQDAINAAKSIMRDMIVYPRKQHISQAAYMKAEHKKARKAKGVKNEQEHNDKDGTLP